MEDFKIKVDNGKYEFILRSGWRLDVLRFGESWVDDVDAAKAIHSMMAELDAARVVLVAARRMLEFCDRIPLDMARAIAGIDGYADGPIGVIRAIGLHDQLVDDRNPPSSRADSTGRYQGLLPNERTR
jgi:hypothetical protein